MATPRPLPSLCELCLYILYIRWTQYEKTCSELEGCVRNFHKIYCTTQTRLPNKLDTLPDKITMNIAMTFLMASIAGSCLIACVMLFIGFYIKIVFNDPYTMVFVNSLSCIWFVNFIKFLINNIVQLTYR